MTLILATDMARHSEIVERFKSKLDTFDFSNADYVGSVSRKLNMKLRETESGKRGFIPLKKKGVVYLILH